MNEQYIGVKQSFLHVDISLAMYAPQAISVFGLVNAAIDWGDPLTVIK